jgi:flagellar hook-associated protein 3 FlgL
VKATVPANGEITLGDEIVLDFVVVSDLTVGDIFYVQALAPGYYNGNGEEMSVNIGEGTPFTYSISGEAAFTNDGEGSVDVFGALNELKQKLENDDPDGIASCLDDLKNASDQISKNISRCGSRVNRLEIAKNNLTDMSLDLAGLISEAEEADVSEIITKFAMKEIVLKASYAVASRIGNLTIIDFLR